ncbi:hypothetical protein EBT16_01690, partial [bacterium]|nr:hypothetical protein [bacterium]
RDLIALDLIQGKFKNRGLNGQDGPLWTIPFYPSPEDIALGVKPRIQTRESLADGKNSLVPRVVVRGIKPAGSSECMAVADYRVSPNERCSVIGGVLSCVSGKQYIANPPPECVPNGMRGSSQFVADSSALASVETLEEGASEEIEQAAFIGISDMGLLSGNPEAVSNLMSDPTATAGEESVAAVPVIFRSYIPHPSQSGLVKGLELQVGETLAMVPIDPPANPTCQLFLPESVKLGDEIDVTMQASSVVSSAAIQGDPVQVTNGQKAASGLREIATYSLKVDKKDLVDVVQIPQTDNAIGVLNVRGLVYGPNAAVPGECSENVQVEFYKPQPPACFVELTPEIQEEGGKVEISVKAYNTVDSAKLVTPTNPLGLDFTFTPPPSPTQDSSYETVFIKTAAMEDVITALVSGPGGQGSCSKTLHWSPPKPPECELSAAPPQVERNRTTIVTLRTSHRVESAQIVTPSETINVKTPYTDSYFDVFNKASYTKVSQVENGTKRVPSGRGYITQKVYKTVTETVTCSCGEKVGLDRAGNSICARGAASVDTAVARLAAESMLKTNSNLCLRESKAKQLLMTAEGSAAFQFKRLLESGVITATVRNETANLEGTCSLNVACPVVAPPNCQLTVAPRSVKTGETATATLSCTGDLTHAAASIDGQLVTLINGSASRQVTKYGGSIQNIVANVKAPSDAACPSRGRYEAQLEALPPCRFINPELRENISVDVSRFNSFYDVFNKTSYLKDKQVADGQIKVNNKWETKYKTVTETIACSCGQKVGLNKQGQQVCMAGAEPIQTAILLEQADPLVNSNPSLCRAVNYSPIASTNEVAFPKGTKWDLMFQYKVVRTSDYIDKENDYRELASYSVPSNDNVYAGELLKSTQMKWTGESACQTDCPDLEIQGGNRFAYEGGDLCLSKATTPVERIIGTGKNKKTIIDDDGICTSEALIGQAFYPYPYWGGTYVKATPGKYTNMTRQLLGKAKYHNYGRSFGVEKICKENHLCAVEVTPRATWNVSDTIFWVEIGPVNDANCQVTMIDTAISVRDKGCFAPDTRIKMANGSEKKVQDIRHDDYVWNPHYRTGIRVKKVAKGPEKKSLYQVVIGKQSIEVTEDHPFLTGRGWLQAVDLKKGDQIFGEGKPKLVSEVAKLPFKDPVDVWNFELDTQDSLAHVVMANGIPTGDLVTQLELKKIRKELP